MKIEHEELESLIPHRGKMFIVGRISDADPENWTIESETKISEDFMFFDESVSGAPNYACFEIIAQTVAALSGLYAREHGLAPNIGFILSVSNLHFDFDIIKSGETVQVKARRETVVDAVSSLSAEIYINGARRGGGKLTVMEAVAGSEAQNQ